MKMPLSEFAVFMRISKEKPVSELRDKILKSLPIEITYESETVFKVVPKNWRNPAFPIH